MSTIPFRDDLEALNGVTERVARKLRVRALSEDVRYGVEELWKQEIERKMKG